MHPPRLLIVPLLTLLFTFTNADDPQSHDQHKAKFPKPDGDHNIDAFNGLPDHSFNNSTPDFQPKTSPKPTTTSPAPHHSPFVPPIHHTITTTHRTDQHIPITRPPPSRPILTTTGTNITAPSTATRQSPHTPFPHSPSAPTITPKPGHHTTSTTTTTSTPTTVFTTNTSTSTSHHHENRTSTTTAIATSTNTTTFPTSTTTTTPHHHGNHTTPTTSTTSTNTTSSDSGSSTPDTTAPSTSLGSISTSITTTTDVPGTPISISLSLSLPLPLPTPTSQATSPSPSASPTSTASDTPSNTPTSPTSTPSNTSPSTPSDTSTSVSDTPISTSSDTSTSPTSAPGDTSTSSTSAPSDTPTSSTLAPSDTPISTSSDTSTSSTSAPSDTPTSPTSTLSDTLTSSPTLSPTPTPSPTFPITSPTTIPTTVNSSTSIVISFPSTPIEPTTTTDTPANQTSTTISIPAPLNYITSATQLVVQSSTTDTPTTTEPAEPTQITNISESDSTATSFPTPSLPPNLPARIFPQSNITQNPDTSKYSIIGILFDQQLNWPFVVQSEVSAGQIFAYMPVIVSTTLDISSSQVTNYALQVYVPSSYKSPVDSDELETLWLAYIPSDKIDALADAIKVKQSPFYTGTSNSIAKSLASHVNSAFPIDSVPDPNLTTSPPADNGKRRLHTIIGVVVGLGAVVALVLGFLVYRSLKRRNTHRRLADPPPDADDDRISPTMSQRSPVRRVPVPRLD